MTHFWLSSVFCIVIATIPHPVFACAVCFVSKRENLMAFFGTGVLLSLLPFALIGGIALWLYRQARTENSDER
jgi:hypothetical protein